MNINEIFHSLQGEGPLIGLPAVFIRFSGCMEPYCPWCDTRHALYESAEMTIIQIADEINRYPGNTVVITGGEPFLQWNTGLSELHTKLIHMGYAIQYETSGKAALPRIDDAVIVCSPKFIQ
ncbi:MAG: 7-carboxy-7-deazaguanine synthase QueE, partial [Deltaproteobacteria bacterium]|nr:7-carboxy-7-deazaguanine synthase QueE [Deltaproteobacteria bacterium]